MQAAIDFDLQLRLMAEEIENIGSDCLLPFEHNPPARSFKRAQSKCSGSVIAFLNFLASAILRSGLLSIPKASAKIESKKPHHHISLAQERASCDPPPRQAGRIKAAFFCTSPLVGKGDHERSEMVVVYLTFFSLRSFYIALASPHIPSFL